MDVRTRVAESERSVRRAPLTLGTFLKMRAALVVLLGIVSAAAFAEKILLIPIDSRPASGQFAEMIGNISDAQVVQPPEEVLGRFTHPGSPESILGWLENQDLSHFDAVVVSTDMIAFGGLIPSRRLGSPYETALRRLKQLQAIRSRFPEVKFYAFSAIMRLAPTATKENASWRMHLGRLAEVRERYRVTRDPAAKRTLSNLLRMIPAQEVVRYDTVRKRNHDLQQALLRLTKYGSFDYVILGQDDAQPFGPHLTEIAALRKTSEALGIGHRVYFAEGVDQQPNVLVSRALLTARGWSPRVRLVYSDERGRKKVAPYESKTIEGSLKDQIIASGARPAVPHGEFDYTLYLNTPNPDPIAFQQFLATMSADLSAGRPVGVADINLGKDGTADPDLFSFLRERNRMVNLISYAGWNTAGNTMGTAIPAANVYLLAKKINANPYRREVAQQEFLLHRFVNDFQYHKFTRPYAYRMIDASSRASREETYGDDFEDVNTFVRQDLGRHLEDTFREQFLGRRIVAGNNEYAFEGLDRVRIYLPWPRAYEVRLEFQLTTRPVFALAPQGPELTARDRSK